ncbi:MmgE/PrpD family protein [Agrobacterium vitis]|uniref:MmgE/PrpD family protein n=1 Tax=Agrobacterium vitis TaxID=373 RepID=UPI0012E85C54|nr:MmgE/PrpD family protein [Agrobacterium vitis]MVA23852.1 MmgE/PrpD family protein [Agrobacterium vitis]
MPFPLTRELAGVVSGIVAQSVPQAVMGRATAAFMDTIGVMIAGCGEPAVRQILSTLASIGSGPPDILDLALIGGTAAHALDFDDVAFGGHVSAVVVPAILAVAQTQPVSGRDMLLAYVAAYETWTELASRETTMYHARGLHPTGLLGPIAAAAAASVLLRLDAKITAHALANAASQGAGLLANFGSMTKPFHAGRAAQSGVLAAYLAQGGYTGAGDALEGATGFLSSFSPAGDVNIDRALNHADGDWMLGKIAPSVKRFPVCYAGHRAIDAMLALRPTAGELERLKAIEVSLSSRHSKTLRYTAPVSVNEARFSLEFFMAAAAVRGWVGLGELTPGLLADPEISRTMGIVIRKDALELDPAIDGWAAADQVTLVYQDGRRVAGDPVRRPRGHADNPVTASDVREKFTDCLRIAGRETEIEVITNAVLTLDSQAAVPASLSASVLLGLAGS